jgi:hypothetical protein
VTVRSWPSLKTRRALRHAFWRHRRSIRAGLVGLTVLCVVQAVSGRGSTDARPTQATGRASPGSTSTTSPRSSDGLVTTVVRLADPSADLLVRPGSVVDVLGVPTDRATDFDPSSVTTTTATPARATAMADVVASGVRVVSVPGHDGDAFGAAGGAVVVVAVTPTTARVLAAAASLRLSLVVRSDATAR